MLPGDHLGEHTTRLGNTGETVAACDDDVAPNTTVNTTEATMHASTATAATVFFDARRLPAVAAVDINTTV